MQKNILGYYRILALLGVFLFVCLLGCGGSSFSFPVASDDHYFDDVLHEGNVIRWVNMPINVYFDTRNTPENWKPEHIGFFEEAMAAWEEVSNGAISFQAIGRQVNPCISVKWVRSISGLTVGIAKITIVGNKFTEVEIEIATSRVNGSPLPDDIMRNISLHELGHAIGLWGHSEEPNDIMYETVQASEISPRDRKTLELIYSVPSKYVIHESTRTRTIEDEEEIIIIMK